jgi:hypothetical protein
MSNELITGDDCKWGTELKAGDEVVYYSGWRNLDKVIVTVTRVTATQIIVGSDRFRSKDGRGYGQTEGYIDEVTEDDRDYCARFDATEEIIKRVSSTDTWTGRPDIQTLPLERLTAILELLKAPTEAEVA